MAKPPIGIAQAFPTRDCAIAFIFADRIQKPLLIGQDANDPRVKQSESDRMDMVLPDQKIGCTFLRSQKSLSPNT
ncbi:hypothetical protein [Nostoc sp.]|uniref:hypothetical protein n=1 Tax=Nostoc sp. TaxID=1180 RepID=UPI002FFAC4A7